MNSVQLQNHKINNRDFLSQMKNCLEKKERFLDSCNQSEIQIIGRSTLEEEWKKYELYRVRVQKSEEVKYVLGFFQRSKQLKSKLEREELLCRELLEEIIAKEYILFRTDEPIRVIMSRKMQRWCKTCSPSFHERIKNLCFQIREKYNLPYPYVLAQ